MTRKIGIRGLAGLILIWTLLSNTYAQQKEQTGVYNPAAAFGPLFYTQNGNEFRSANGSPGKHYWQNRADYSISAKLDEENNTIQGTVVITYRNNSPDKLPFLWLQMDQNLFRKDSRGEAVIFGTSRYGSQGEKIDGGYKIKKISVEKKGKPVAYTEVREDTRMQLRLSHPMEAAGDELKIRITYSFVVPKNGSGRMGHVVTKNGEIYAIGQWFPRMCVYDDVLGWNTFPYLGAGQFYCEYGNVDFAVTAPASHIVMASGELLNPGEVFSSGQLRRWVQAKMSDKVVHVRTEAEVLASLGRKGTLTWKYRIKNARDAAWSSSKSFVLDAARINLPSGKKSLAVSAQPIEVNGTDAYGRAQEYIKAAVEFYSANYYEYPYPMAVNIASDTEGMEYPGIVFCGLRAKGIGIWRVINHEIGHTWFPMIVGSNERKYGWMDEGFSTFINEYATAAFNKGEYASKKNYDVGFLTRSLDKNPQEGVMLLPDGMQESSVPYQSYEKPAIGLKLLRNQVLGPERFDYAFREYIRNWAFKHPTPFDFFRSIENGAGEDLSWFWRAWFIENWKLDQAISSVKEIRKLGALEGYDILISNLEKMPMPIILEVTSRDGQKKRINVGVDVWMRNSSWTINFPTKMEIVSVELDPDKLMPDINAANNIWKNVK